MEWWEHGACFGIAKPLDALADCDVAHTNPTQSPAIGPEDTHAIVFDEDTEDPGPALQHQKERQLSFHDLSDALVSQPWHRKR